MVREVKFSWDESEFYENPWRSCLNELGVDDELLDLPLPALTASEFEEELAAERYILSLTERRQPGSPLLISVPVTLAPPVQPPAKTEPRGLAGADWLGLPWVAPTPASRYRRPLRKTP